MCGRSTDNDWSLNEIPGRQAEGGGLALPLGQAWPVPAGLDVRVEELKLADGYRTGVWIFTPQKSALDIPVLYVHGIQSHPGWFVGSACRIALTGRRVFMPIRRGSGDASMERGHADSAKQLLDDIDSACRFALDRADADRLHLAGVSWGGKLLASYAVSRGAGWSSSLTLIAPGIAPKVDMSARGKLLAAVSLLVNPRRRFDIPLNDERLFTSNPQMIDYLAGDRFRLHRVTAGFLYASRCLDRMIARAPSGAIGLPVALILARGDRIIDNRATRRIVEHLTAGRVEVLEIDGEHTLDFEVDPQGFYETLVGVLSRRSKPAD